MEEKDFIYGSRAIIEAIKSSIEIDKLFIARKSESEISKELLDLAKEYKIPLQYAPVEKLNRITRKNHQGAIAFISSVSYVPLEELISSCYEQGKDPLFVILDQISDVRNFGAIARSAECMGFNGIIIAFKGAAKINADAVKTSAGALLKIPVSRVKSLANSIKFLKDSGVQIISVTEKASEICYNANLTGPLALVIGSEDRGISPNLLYLSDQKVQIPMEGETESLNVSVATSVLLYEVKRQRNSK